MTSGLARWRFFVGGMGACISIAVTAQTYPNRPIKLIVPFAPGGGSDIIARIIAPRLGDAVGQQVVIDNKLGAGTIIGAEIAAKAAPDGYTLFVGITGTLAINPSLYQKLPYDPLRDFSPIILVATGPNILVVHPSLPVKTVRELIALAKSKPGDSRRSPSLGQNGRRLCQNFQPSANP